MEPRNLFNKNFVNSFFKLLKNKALYVSALLTLKDWYMIVIHKWVAYWKLVNILCHYAGGIKRRNKYGDEIEE